MHTIASLNLSVHDLIGTTASNMFIWGSLRDDHLWMGFNQPKRKVYTWDMLDFSGTEMNQLALLIQDFSPFEWFKS